MGFEATEHNQMSVVVRKKSLFNFRMVLPLFSLDYSKRSRTDAGEFEH